MFERIHRGISFANVVSLIALFVALGGGAYAAVKLKRNAVKSKHIAAEAVQGKDANESTFDTVPRANAANTADTATNATNADNASTIDGIGVGDLQFGDGIDDAAGGSVLNGQTG